VSLSLGHTPVSLLDRLRDSRQEPDWERFVTIYVDLIRGWLLRSGIVTADVDDLQQDVMMALLRAIPQFKHNGRPGAFRKWLKILILQRVLNFYRSRRRQSAVDRARLSEQVLMEIEDRMLPPTWEKEHDEHVLARILALVEPEFTVSTWKAFQEQVLRNETPARVAANLGVSVNAVIIAKSRVMKRLREEAAGLVD
jgi:RNA polymerase sigma factor (sigma-70 family)